MKDYFDYDENDISELYMNHSLISTCCGALPEMQPFDSNGYISGVCSECGNNATFEQEIEDETY